MADLLANGLHFNVVRLGGGDTSVVFLHGLVIDNLSSFYYTLANPIAAHCDVVLYDQRGHGRSERPPLGYRPDDGVADLAAILDGLGLDRPVYLCGNSYGCLIALLFAAAYPERVAGLILLEGHMIGPGWGERTLETVDFGLWLMREEDQDEWVALRRDRRGRNQIESADELIATTSLVVDLRYAPLTDVGALARLDCPTLALYGERSDVLDVGRTLAATLPKVDFRVLADCSHSILMEQAATVRDHVIGWLWDQGALGAPAAEGVEWPGS